MTRWKAVAVSGALMAAAWVPAAGAQTTAEPPAPVWNPQPCVAPRPAIARPLVHLLGEITPAPGAEAASILSPGGIARDAVPQLPTLSRYAK